MASVAASAPEEAEALQVLSLKVSPNPAPIGAPVAVDARVRVCVAVREGVWRLQWLVDSARKRYQILLASSDPSDIAAGAEVSVRLSSGPVDVSSLKPSTLTNAGLLILSLHQGGADASVDSPTVATIQAVVTASPGPAGLVRTVLNPWDE